MPRPRKYADMIVKSFCVEKQVYESFRAILTVQGRSLSEEVNELLKRRLAELQGLKQQSSENDANYESLKREHVRLVEETMRLIKLLQKNEALEDLTREAEKLGLDHETLDNIEYVAQKLLQNWNGPKAQAHIFITLLETAQKRKQIEKQLEERRLKTSEKR